MKKFALLAALAVTSVLGALSSAPVFADSPGQLGGGDLYQVRNVTENTGYSNNVSAVCNDTVKFSFKLSNTAFGMIYGVKVSANLQTGSATATGKNSANENLSVSDTANVSLSEGSLSYIAGSTKLYNVKGGLVKNLSDGVTNGGVTTGNLPGSTRQFVQFQAKVECEEQPRLIQVCELATKNIITIDEKDYDTSKHSKNFADCEEEGEMTVCRLDDKKIVIIKEGDFDSSKHTKDLSKCEETPVTPPELPQTGGNTGALVAVVAALLTAGAAYAVAARRNVLG